jgi:hypothetical protein
MKKTAIILLMITICAAKTMAQKETKTSSFGFGLEAGAPVGSYSNIYTLGAGLTLRYSYHAGPGFVTLTTGAIGFAPKIVAGQKGKAGIDIPLRFGYKYVIQQHFFVSGELGYVSIKTYYGSNGKTLSNTQGSVLAAIGAGYQYNAFEIGLRFETHPAVSGSTIGVRLGFNF